MKKSKRNLIYCVIFLIFSILFFLVKEVRFRLTDAIIVESYNFIGISIYSKQAETGLTPYLIDGKHKSSKCALVSENAILDFKIKNFTYGSIPTDISSLLFKWRDIDKLDEDVIKRKIYNYLDALDASICSPNGHAPDIDQF